MWKKAVITALSVVTLGVGSVYAENSLQTVHHVYIGGQEIGTIQNKEQIQEYVKDYVDEAESKHKDWEISLMEDVTYEKDKVFSADTEDNKVMNELKKELSIAAEAVMLNVNGQPVAFLPNEAEAKQVVTKMKQKYVDAEDLEMVEKDSQSEEVAAGEAMVTDVRLTGVVTYEDEKISPLYMDSVDEAMDRLENGASIEAKTAALPTSPLVESSHDPMLDVMVYERERQEETIEHSVEVKNTDDLYVGESKVTQSGKDGVKERLVRTVTRNGEQEKETILEEEMVQEPVTKVILKGTKQPPSIGTGNFVWPAVGGTITSKQGKRWGRQHKGIDIAGVSNRTIKAADNGKVIEAGYRNSFGNKVVIDHGNGYETLYAHLSSIDVNVGDVVQKGESLGVMGTTGHSTGIHLHFEVHKNGALENPLSHVSLK
ncbi:peptidoglycan DD-metalloendopeptidase family protein [Halobacillus litoralis]|uniref:peptidoglycan DD-metalloendopeptidase family protein n=1 Tax=Halobacillus litoralis TaxID=45668 RepID=UPI001CFD585E|nr:peptidoglycan DD-metalloendopeptidase family protein [Halobacillus litoralis]